MGTVHVHINGKVIDKEDYSFDLMIVACLLGMATVAASVLLGTLHTTWGLLMMLIMVLLAYVLLSILKKHQRLVYQVTVGHEQLKAQ
jgi:succinate-acetate transporter protein